MWGFVVKLALLDNFTSEISAAILIFKKLSALELIAATHKLVKRMTHMKCIENGQQIYKPY